MGERKKIGLHEVRALALGKTIWDAEVRGFGARRQQGDRISYFLKYRTADGRQRWFTIGQHGQPWTPDTARKRARELQVEASRGRDPAADKLAKRRAVTVAELCDLYMVEAEKGRLLKRDRTPKKSTTLVIDRGRIDRHIKPLIGGLGVGSVTREDVEQLLHDVTDGKSAGRTKTKSRGLARVTGGATAASRVIGLLGAIFNFAVVRRMRPDNPVRGVIRPADRKRNRRLTDEEFASLGQSLRAAEGSIWPAAIAAARFMAMTGWRRGEVLCLKWSEIDVKRRTASLPDTKTGRSIRPLSHAAIDILNSMRGGGDLVFPATRGDGPMVGFPKLWARIRKRGDLPADVTAHVMRHSFISVASDLGFVEATIGAMVGHASRSMTGRYTHSADGPLLAAADTVANRIRELMNDLSAQAIVLPFAKPSAP